VKFYHYSQNNSGGSFVFNRERGITHHVVIEAANYKSANAKAEEIGLYFDGRGDCECCGNRWSELNKHDTGYSKPCVYGEPVEAYDGHCWMTPNPEIVVHYAKNRPEPMPLREALDKSAEQ
jgi:hypothetical protein